MGRKGSGRKLVMGESSSLRPNKDYMSQEALAWINDQSNANEAICRAIDFYYRYLNDTHEITELINKAQVFEDKEEESPEIVEKEALAAVSKMISSVKR